MGLRIEGQVLDFGIQTNNGTSNTHMQCLVMLFQSSLQIGGSSNVVAGGLVHSDEDVHVVEFAQSWPAKP